MKAAERAIVSKSGMEGLRGVGILAGARGDGAPATGLALKIEDGDSGATGRTYAAAVEALRPGPARSTARRSGSLARYHRPPSLDPHGQVVAEAIPEFARACRELSREPLTGG